MTSSSKSQRETSENTPDFPPSLFFFSLEQVKGLPTATPVKCDSLKDLADGVFLNCVLCDVYEGAKQ
jgi:hypothetical protein